MTLKRFRIRDIVINLPVDPGQIEVEMCAEQPSVPGCLDMESIIPPTCWDQGTILCLNGISPECLWNTHRCNEGTVTFILCWKNGVTIKECIGETQPPVCGWMITEVPCVAGSPSICEEQISPLVHIPDCDDRVTMLVECMQVSMSPTPVIDGVNTPVILERISGAADLPSLKRELSGIMAVLDDFEIPSTPEDLEAVEMQLSKALSDIRTSRKAAQSGE